MKHTAITILVASLLFAVALPAMAQPTSWPRQEKPGPAEKEIVQSINQFAWAAYDKLPQGIVVALPYSVDPGPAIRVAAGCTEGNLFFSPYSIDTALAMTYAGARGDTAREMAAALHLPADMSDAQIHAAMAALMHRLEADKKDAGYELHVANALWGHKDVQWVPDFLDLVKKNYVAELAPVDFAQSDAARKQINDWVAKQTQDKIKDLLGPGSVNKDTRLVLTNAIYMKAAWASQFAHAATHAGTFTTPDRQDMPVQMMRQTSRFGYADTPACQALSMSYEGGRLAMLVLLPHETPRPGTNGHGNLPHPPMLPSPARARDLADLEQTLLDAKAFDAILRKLAATRVHVEMPKFKMDSSFSVADALKGLGMKTAFSSTADFSGMDGKTDLLISDVIHKAYILVDEDGTEAAAATGVTITPMAMPVEQPPVDFIVDHPFVVVIYDQASGAALFIGRVVKPGV